MSTWIFEPRRALLVAPLLLAACLAGFGLSRQAPEVARVAGDTVAIAGPAGYCVDPVGTRETSNGAFVLLGSCAALNGPGAPHPGRLAVLTASVAAQPGEPAVAELVDELAAVFTTEAGLAMLSRSGEADSVTLLETEPRDGVLYLRLRDTSGFDGPPVAEEYWRAILDAGGRMVMLSVIPLVEPQMSSEAAHGLLQAFVARVRRENAPAAPVAAEETREAGGEPTGALLRAIRNG
jgi:hypothetical protein